MQCVGSIQVSIRVQKKERRKQRGQTKGCTASKEREGRRRVPAVIPMRSKCSKVEKQQPGSWGCKSTSAPTLQPSILSPASRWHSWPSTTGLGTESEDSLLGKSQE